MNFMYNATVNVMEASAPIIQFHNQTLAQRRILVFLKCLMVFSLEHRDPDMILVQRLQNNLVYCYAGLSFIMIALSAELIWKAVPIMLFVYACQVQKLVALNSNLRRCLSYMVFVFGCLEFMSFELVYDFYLILCFLFKSLYSLSQHKDLEQRERNGLQRASMLLAFLAEMALVAIPHWSAFWTFFWVNAVVSFCVCMFNKRTLYVVILFSCMSQIFTYQYATEADMDKSFDDIFVYLTDSFVNFLYQFSFGGLIP